MAYLRLRQVCLVARELAPVVDDLCRVLGLQVCHRDPGVERFGLHNALMRMGSAFIEVVAPLPGSAGTGTAATRHLERRGGDSGYMVILDCDAVAPWRAHMAHVGVREASYLQVPGATTGAAPCAYTGLQLHPRDTGGTLLEINHTAGGDALDGAYWPAGPDWQNAPDGSLGATLAGVTLRATEAAPLAERWAQILKRPLTGDSGAQALLLDNGCSMHFADASTPQEQGFTQVDLHLKADSSAAQRVFDGVAERALVRGCVVDSRQRAVRIGGVWWRFD